MANAVPPRGYVTGTRDQVKPQYGRSPMLAGMDHVPQTGLPTPPDSIVCAAAAPTTDRSQSFVTRHQGMSLTSDASFQKPGPVDEEVHRLTARLRSRHL